MIYVESHEWLATDTIKLTAAAMLQAVKVKELQLHAQVLRVIVFAVRFDVTVRQEDN